MKTCPFLVLTVSAPPPMPLISIRKIIQFAAAVSLSLTSAGSAQAFSQCFEQAGQRYGISPVLLKSIAAHESGFNSRAVGHNNNGSEDIGLMQINSEHLPVLSGYGITRAHLFDPCLNINVGAWLLAGNIRRHGARWEAVGAYNAGCKAMSREECVRLRSSYVAAVQRNMTRVGDF